MCNLKGCQLSSGLVTMEGTSWKADCGHMEVARICPMEKKIKINNKKTRTFLNTWGVTRATEEVSSICLPPRVKTEVRWQALLRIYSELSPLNPRFWLSYFQKPMALPKFHVVIPASVFVNNQRLISHSPLGRGIRCARHLKGSENKTVRWF